MCKIYKHFLTKHLYDVYLIISDIKTVTLFNQWLYLISGTFRRLHVGHMKEGTFTETDCGIEGCFSSLEKYSKPMFIVGIVLMLVVFSKCTPFGEVDGPGYLSSCRHPTVIIN